MLVSCCVSATTCAGQRAFGLHAQRAKLLLRHDACAIYRFWTPRHILRNRSCLSSASARHEQHNKMATQQQQQNDDPVVIVGGGLAGALMAVYLAKRGFKVETYERRPDMRKEAISAGRSINLALSVRGTTALAQAGISEDILGISIPMRGRMVHPLGGAVNFQPYSPDYEKVSLYSVSRGMLNMKLIDIAEKTAGINFHFDSKCAGVDFAKKEISFTNLKTNNTTKLKAKAIIGCDGAYSSVRYNMMKRDRFEYSQSFIEHSYKELSIPPNPDGTHILDKECLHIWPRGSYMMIALPNIDGSFTCTLFLANEGPHPSFATLTTEAKVETFFKDQFPDVYLLMPTLLHDFFANPTSSLVTIRCFPWVVGDASVLVGDAAHAIVPFYGQGMNAAFESCQELIERMDKNPNDWEKAFKEYQAARKPNTDAIAALALQNFIEMRDLVADPDFVFAKKVEHLLEEKFKDRYVSQYELVSFSTVPYSIAQQTGATNKKLLAELTKNAERDISKIDLQLADRLIKEYFNK
eukprot:Phypoly_transcript_05496.p1 GENE.Phypoly_transcript_05496~~Phypoly_transcript_05496.p1  ORF type:complete len:524 (+),score=75.56 Phypoly_transcript_05496:335-1906(+)